MLCDHLEGWDRKGDARGKRYGDICIYVTGSLCYKAETNTPLLSNYTPIKMLKKKRKERKIKTNRLIELNFGITKYKVQINFITKKVIRYKQLNVKL